MAPEPALPCRGRRRFAPLRPGAALRRSPRPNRAGPRAATAPSALLLPPRPPPPPLPPSLPRRPGKVSRVPGLCVRGGAGRRGPGGRSNAGRVRGAAGGPGVPAPGGGDPPSGAGRGGGTGGGRRRGALRRKRGVRRGPSGGRGPAGVGGRRRGPQVRREGAPSPSAAAAVLSLRRPRGEADLAELSPLGRALGGTGRSGERERRMWSGMKEKGLRRDAFRRGPRGGVVPERRGDGNAARDPKGSAARAVRAGVRRAVRRVGKPCGAARRWTVLFCSE